MGACLSRGDFEKKNGEQSSAIVCHHDSSPKNLSFVYKNRTVSTVVMKSTALNDLNSVLLSAFDLDESTYVVTGVLVTLTGPLMPFFMLPYLHANKPENPYPIITALVTDFAINNWGCAPDLQDQTDTTVEWSDIEALGSDSDLYSSPSSAKLATRVFDLLRCYGYVRLHLPPTSVFQAATASIHRYCAFPEEEKRKKFLGFHQQKFVGYSRAKGSARQFVQLRTTKGTVTQTGKNVPVFDTELTEAYLALQAMAYQLFKLLCHPHLTPQSHLSPEFFSSLLDAPCLSVDDFNQCSSVPPYQFLGTNVFRVYQYLRNKDVTKADVNKGNVKKDELPGFLGAATSVHSDMGLLTVSPQSNLPGLTVLKHSDASRWVNVEMQPGSGSDAEENYVFVFAGETMAHLTKGALLAPLHFVDERTPTLPRFSMPFFLRARQKCVLPAVEGMCAEMTVESFMQTVLPHQKQVWGQTPTTDF